MATKQENPGYDDLNIRLAEAIRLLAERVTPRPLHPDATEAINKHAELTRRLQFVFQETPAPSTDK
jgi:hypothetical protein